MNPMNISIQKFSYLVSEITKILSDSNVAQIELETGSKITKYP